MSGYAPTRKFAEDIHGYGEFCKYGHIRQAMVKGYRWKKQTDRFDLEPDFLD